MIKIERLTKNYGSNCAVDDISFEYTQSAICLAVKAGIPTVVTASLICGSVIPKSLFLQFSIGGAKFSAKIVQKSEKQALLT